MKVSIIIPVFNQLSYTIDCLKTLEADESVRALAEIIVVDNGSTDGTREYLENLSKSWSALKPLYFDKNLGFSLACNAGAEISSGEELLFLNNDTIPEKGWLEALRNTLRLPFAGVIGPKLLYPSTRRVQHCGYVYNKQIDMYYPIYHGTTECFWGVNYRREYQAVLGACILIRRQLFEEVGRFTNHGLEDIDLCLKVREMGHRVFLEPKAVVLHHGSVTIKNSPIGSLPEMTAEYFRARWPFEERIHDDYSFYLQDGLIVSPNDQGKFIVKVRIEEAQKLVVEANSYQKEGNTLKALETLERTMEFHTGNDVVYCDLVTLNIEAGDLAKALKWAELRVENVPHSYSAKWLLAELHERFGSHERALEILEELELDWLTPRDSKLEVEVSATPSVTISSLSEEIVSEIDLPHVNKIAVERSKNANESSLKLP